MPEEMNAFEGPLEGGPLGEGMKGVNTPKVGMDQTNWDSSLEKAAVDGAIADGDKKLEDAIAKQGEALGSEITEVNDTVGDVKGQVSALESTVESNFTEINETVTFLAGDKDGEFTPGVIKKGLKEFATDIQWAIETAQNDDALEADKRRAQFFINNYGEEFSTIGAVMYILSDFISVTGNLSTEQMTEYSQHVEDLRNNLVDIYEQRDDLEVDEDGKPVNPDMFKAISEEINKSEQEFVRITEADILNPDVIKLRNGDVDGAIQYYYDLENRADDEFRTHLAVNRIGDASIGSQYKEHKDAFEAAAKHAETTIEYYDATVEAGEEVSDEEKMRYDGAKKFEEEFTLVSNMISILSFIQYYEEDKYADFSEQAFDEYVSAIEDWKQSLEAAREQKENAETPEEVKEADALIGKTTEDLSRYAEYDEMSGEWLNFYPGFVLYYQDKESQEFDLFKKDLRENVIGDVNAGEYYKTLKNRFEAALMTAMSERKQVQSEEEELGEGEELSQESKILKSKSDWFITNFGERVNHIGVTSFESFEDDFLSADFSADAYDNYVSDMEDKKQSLESAKEELEENPNPETEKLVSMLEEELDTYTCSTDFAEYVLCEPGFVLWAQKQHDLDEKSFREENTEVIGITPSVQVPYLKEQKSTFQSEMKEAIDIVDSEEVSDIAMYAGAQEFLDRFGRIVNASSYANWSLYKRELEMSAAIAGIETQILCTVDALAREVNDAVVLTTTQNATFFPIPDGSANSFTLLVEGEYRVVSVSRNGIEQKEGLQYVNRENSINFAPGQSPNANDSLIITVEVTSNIDVDGTLCEITLPDTLKQGEYACKTIERVIETLEDAIDSLNGRKDDLTKSDEYHKKLVDKLTDAIESYTTLAADLAETIKVDSASLLKITEVIKGLKEDISNYTAEVEALSKSVEESSKQKEDKERNKDLTEQDVKILNLELKIEEGRAYPDGDAIAKLEADIKSKTDEVDALKAEIEKLDQSIKDDSDKLDKTRDDLTEANDAHLKESRDAAKVEGSISTSNERVMLLESNIKFNNDYKTDSEERLAQIAEQLKSLETAKAEREAHLAATHKTKESVCDGSTFNSLSNNTTRNTIIESANRMSNRMATSSNEQEKSKDGEVNILPILEVVVRDGQGGPGEPSAITVSAHCAGYYNHGSTNHSNCVNSICDGSWGDWSDTDVDTGSCPAS
jgi:hypothetical protein